MKNIIHFAIENIEWDMVKKVMDLVNQLNDDYDYIIKLHLRSIGGYADCRDVLANILNGYDHEIHLAYAESCGFELLYLLNGSIHINDWSYGMYHGGVVDIKFREGLKETNRTKMQKMMAEYEAKRTEEIMERLEFKNSEKRDVLEGKDVFFSARRLKELFHYKLL